MNGNAKIISTMLGYEDHGIMTCFLYLRQGASGQGFGGYGLDGPYDKVLKERLPNKLCGFWIKRILETVGITKWENLPGNHIRVIGVKFGNDPITAIGHITEDKWFHPKKEMKKFEEKE